MTKIRVLIVDDSALIRQLLSRLLSSAPDIEVVGTAADPYIAREKIKALKPDVLTLDVEMPRMDGLAFLQHLMRLRPMPVVMISALTERGADITLQALEYGAVDFVSKPKLDIAETFHEYADEIINKIRAAATANIRPVLNLPKVVKKVSPTPTTTSIHVPPKYSADVIIATQSHRRPFRTTEKIIAIGASTGGTEAIKFLLSQLPAHTPGIVISQHIPSTFSYSFAQRMNQISVMTVYEATHQQVILPGHVYIAPGSHHLLIERDGARYVCRLHEGSPVNRHRPSVDVMFRSVAQNVGPNAVGVILTGMGDDGAHGMLEMHQAGAVTIAQDEHSSVVWGMPGESVRLGGVDHVVPLSQIPQRLLNLLEIN
jgi:two-component system, chemotaxis family, protein-glutamate methylesterase/glutaminase